MSNILRALIALSCIAFILAVLGSIFTFSLITSPEGYSRACKNLALISIALAVCLKNGDKIMASDSAPLEVGNALSLAKIPVGTQIHNIEIKPGKGGQLVKSAGAAAIIHGKEEDYVLVKLFSLIFFYNRFFKFLKEFLHNFFILN